MDDTADSYQQAHMTKRVAGLGPVISDLWLVRKSSYGRESVRCCLRNRRSVSVS